jgi:hypothetical protein
MSVFVLKSISEVYGYYVKNVIEKTSAVTFKGKLSVWMKILRTYS